MRHFVKGAALGLAVLGAGCHPAASEPQSGLQEAPDSKNGIAHFDLNAMPTYDEIAATPQVFTTHLPWSDTYWPYTSQAFARRWGAVGSNSSSAGFSAFLQGAIDESASDEPNVNLSPAEKYDTVYRLRWNKAVDMQAAKNELKALSSKEKELDHASSVDDKRKVMASLYTMFAADKNLRGLDPLAADGWSLWLSYNKNPNYKYRDVVDSGEDWSWMGYCHGWSPAALMHEAPKHSVLAKIGDKKVFFGEGDIRGLLTHSWGNHSPGANEYFLGRRCNENTEDPSGEIPHTADGRGASGTFVNAAGETETFTQMDEYLPGAAAAGRRIYEITIDPDPAQVFLVENTVNGAVSYYLSTDASQMKQYVETGDVSALLPVKNVKFYGCWDVNPASFHTVLTEYLGKRNLGFVMDRTRTGQVWNQPVYGARFTVGALQDAATVDDPLFRYRAAGTTYLAVVTTEVLWSSEPSKPSLDYDDNFDKNHISSSKYTYTLEFDADKRLIGGEWGDLKPVSTKLVEPDFLFAFKAGSLPVDDVKNNFDFSGVIKPIYDCSQATDGLKTMTVNGQSLTYTECDIAPAQ